MDTIDLKTLNTKLDFIIDRLNLMPDHLNFPPVKGKKIKKLRELRGVSLDDLAIAIQINKSTLWRIETEKTKFPDIKTINKILTYLEIEFDEIN